MKPLPALILFHAVTFAGGASPVGELFIDEQFGYAQLPEVVFREDAPVAGGVRDLMLRVYVPSGEGVPAVRPAFLGCPGGSFSGQYFDAATCQRWAKRGYVVFSMAPRSRHLDNPPPTLDLGAAFLAELEAGISRIGFPGPSMVDAAGCQFSDVMMALAFIRDHAAAYGVDPSRIVMAGTSSGNVTMNNALYCSDEMGFGTLPARAGAMHAGAMAPPAQTYVQPGGAPLFIIHGTADGAVPIVEAAAMHDTLTELGIGTEFHPLPGVGHDTIPALTDPAFSVDGDLLITRQARFFAQHLALNSIASGPQADYAGWITHRAVPGAQQAAGFDPDHDGADNLTEYAAGTEPAVAASFTAPAATVRGGRFGLRFQRVPGRADITLAVQAADSPAGPWTSLAASTNGAATVPLLAGTGVQELPAGEVIAVTVVHPEPIAGPASRRFLRLAISTP